MTPLPPPASGAPAPPAERHEASPPPGWLSADLRTLGRGLVAYGIVGLVLAVVGLAIAVVLLGRLNSVGDRITPQLTTISETIDSTIAALDQASTTSQTFGATLTATAPALDSVASSIDTIQPTLAAAGSSLSGVSILGQRPFEQVGTLFTQVSNELAGLSPQLKAVSASLGANQASLAAMGESLDTLARSLEKAKVTLSDVIWTFLLAMLLLVAFFAVPAVAALAIGLWLLRRVLPSMGPPVVAGA
jgi:phage-related tail protein